MNEKQRLQLQNMIKANNVEDQTQLIRNLKHSHILRSEVNNLLILKEKYKDDDDQLYNECINNCNFLFTYYTEIFNKIRKDEIDINILNNFLDVLKQIEDNELDQHEGSFKIGSILKELYVDSALKKADKINERYDINIKQVPQKKNISWSEFKNKNK
jgi:hypothetical protein